MFDSLRTSTEAVGLLCILVILVLIVIMLLFGTIIEWFKKRKLRRGNWAALSEGESQKEEFDIDNDTTKDEWQTTELGTRRSVCTFVRQPLSSTPQLPDGHFLAPASSWMSHTKSRKEESVPVDMSEAVLSSQHHPLNAFVSVSPAKKFQSTPEPKNTTLAAKFAKFETRNLITSASIQPSAAPITKLLPLPPHTPPHTPTRNIFSSPLRSPDTPAFRMIPSTNRVSLPLHTMRKFRPLPPLPVFQPKDDCGGLRAMESTKGDEEWLKAVGVARCFEKPMTLQAHTHSSNSVIIQKQDKSSANAVPFDPASTLRQAEAKGAGPPLWTPQKNNSSSPMPSPPTLISDAGTRYSQSSTPLARLQYSQTPPTSYLPYTPRISDTAQTPSSPPNQDLYFLPLTSPNSSAWNSPTRPIFFEPTMTPPSAFSSPSTQTRRRLSKQELCMKPVPPIPSVSRGSKYEDVDVSGSGFSPLPLRSSNPTRPAMLLRLPTLSAFPATTNIPRKPLPITKKPTPCSVPVKPTDTTTQSLAHHRPLTKYEEQKRRSQVTFLEEDWSDLEITPEEEEKEEDVELELGKRGRMIAYPTAPRGVAWR